MDEKAQLRRSLTLFAVVCLVIELGPFQRKLFCRRRATGKLKAVVVHPGDTSRVERAWGAYRALPNPQDGGSIIRVDITRFLSRLPLRGCGWPYWVNLWQMEVSRKSPLRS